MDIDEILKTQAQLQIEMGLPVELRKGESAVKEAVLACATELFEVLGEINWKPWRKTRKSVDDKKVIEELCDVLQFWANAVNAAGISHEEISVALRKKWTINRARIKDDY